MSSAKINPIFKFFLIFQHQNPRSQISQIDELTWWETIDLIKMRPDPVMIIIFLIKRKKQRLWQVWEKSVCLNEWLSFFTWQFNYYVSFFFGWGIYLLSGIIHKPRGQLRGEGVNQMTVLKYKPYLVKVTTKGGQKYPKICPRGLWMTPSFTLEHS